MIARARWSALLVVGWLAPCAVFGQPGPTLRLHRGMNVTFWRAPAPRLFTPADARSLRSMGFDFVRLQVNAALLERPASADSLLPDLARELDTLNAVGLKVIVDMHPAPAFVESVLSDSGARDRYLAALALVSRSLASRSPDSVAIELLNEPARPANAPAGWSWNAIQRRLWQAARRGAPRLTIIATGLQGPSIIAALRGVALLPDRNVIYTFHYYHPFIFTYQGAFWGGIAPAYRAMRDVPYPSTPRNVQARLGKSLAAAPNSAVRENLRVTLTRYGEDRWDRARILQDLRPIAAWAHKNDVRVFAGEFGVWATYVEPRDRYAWIRDVRTDLEQLGIGWAMWRYWDHGGGFGLIGKDGKPDPKLLAALGVRQRP